MYPSCFLSTCLKYWSIDYINSLFDFDIQSFSAGVKMYIREPLLPLYPAADCEQRISPVSSRQQINQSLATDAAQRINNFSLPAGWFFCPINYSNSSSGARAACINHNYAPRAATSLSRSHFIEHSSQEKQTHLIWLCARDKYKALITFGHGKRHRSRLAARDASENMQLGCHST